MVPLLLMVASIIVEIIPSSFTVIVPLLLITALAPSETIPPPPAVSVPLLLTVTFVPRADMPSPVVASVPPASIMPISINPVPEVRPLHPIPGKPGASSGGWWLCCWLSAEPV